MRLRYYLTEKKKLSNTMIGFEVDPGRFKRVSDYIESWLVRYDIKYERVKNKHFSIAQITGKYRKNDLTREVNSIDKNIKFKPRDIQIFRGKNVPKDFIVARYYPHPKFVQIFKEIASKFKVRYFDEIAPHVSLFTIEQGKMSDKIFKEMLFSIPQLPKVKPTGKDLFNRSFKVEYKKK